MKKYFRALLRSGTPQPQNSLNLAGQKIWFEQAEVLERGKASKIVSLNEIPDAIIESLISVRSNFVFGDYRVPKIMGILNITPDSFSDGGQYYSPKFSVDNLKNIASLGADILDVGGESTRPGADFVCIQEELKRVVPIIKELFSHNFNHVISVDTRKSEVMRTAMDLGVNFINDVSALSFDSKSLSVVASQPTVISLMHGNNDPKTMQINPQYDNVLLDVYDYLSQRKKKAIEAGISSQNIILDPGIGFGKTIEHNLALIRGISLFHSLGCPLLVGVSRKRFIGDLANEPQPKKRLPGSITVALELLRQGVQIIRVHDIKATRQALNLWNALL